MVATSTAPLLRSPPFPWVGKQVAAVSRPGQSTLRDPDRLFAAMRENGVGGSFWLSTAAGGAAADALEGGILRWIAREPGEPDRRMEAVRAVEAACYRNPFSGAPCDAHEAVKILADWRRTLSANRPIVAAAGMSAWKREAIGRFLWDGEKQPPFHSVERNNTGPDLAHPSRSTHARPKMRRS